MTYTAEQVFLRSEDVKYSADIDFRLTPACAADICKMLRDYAALLRERESAKTKSDPVAWRYRLDGDMQWQHTSDKRICMGEIEPLYAVAPVLASESSEELKEWEEFGRQIEKRLRYNPWGFKGSYPEIIDQVMKLASVPFSDEKLLNGCLIAMQTAQYQQASARVPESLEVAGYVDPDQVRSTQQVGGSVGIGSFSSRYGRTVPVYWDGTTALKPETEE